MNTLKSVKIIKFGLNFITFVHKQYLQLVSNIFMLLKKSKHQYETLDKIKLLSVNHVTSRHYLVPLPINSQHFRQEKYNSPTLIGTPYHTVITGITTVLWLYSYRHSGAFPFIMVLRKYIRTCAPWCTARHHVRDKIWLAMVPCGVETLPWYSPWFPMVPSLYIPWYHT